MNSSKEVNHYCVTLRLNENKIYFESSGDGSYNDAMIRGVAVYPNYIHDIMKG